MEKRFVSIWFHHLTTDWFSLRQSHLKQLPFVLRASSHGRMMITAANRSAEKKGIRSGMVLADARAIVPDLQALDDKPDLIDQLLKRLAEWCIRFTPFVAVDPPDGLLLDASGCSHLWGGDDAYVKEIMKRLHARGYEVRVAMADTVGVAWGIARFGILKKSIGEDTAVVIESKIHIEALMGLPPEALRLDSDTVARLHKLGLHQVRQFIKMPRASLRRRFGVHFIRQLDRALGQEMEMIEPVVPVEPYQERLPCMEPIVTAPGIAIALQQLLETLCHRLQQEQKGLRAGIFKGYRVDGKVEVITIGTHRASHHVRHLFKLFEFKLPTIEPALGIELFTLDSRKRCGREVAAWKTSAYRN